MAAKKAAKKKTRKKSAKKKPAKRMGRPRRFDREMMDELVERIARGEALVNIVDDMHERGGPSYMTVLRWLRESEQDGADQELVDFRKDYAQARADQADFFADEIITIADDGRNDTYVDEDGRPKVDYDHIQRSKLRVDSRKWHAGRMAPNKYLDRHITIGGRDGGPIFVRETVEAQLEEALEQALDD